MSTHTQKINQTRPVKDPWVVLFGGAGREKIIDAMLAQGIEVESILIPSTRRQRLSSAIDLFLDSGIRVEFHSKEGFEEVLFAMPPKRIISVGFPYKIRKRVIDHHKTLINVHPTLLPKYRGPTSGAYIILNDEKYTGSTVHYVSEDYDDGPILAQSKIRISPFDTVRSLQKKTYALEADLVTLALRRVYAGEEPVPQDRSQISIYPEARNPRDSEIDPKLSLNELVKYIRASDPIAFPAYFMHHGEKVYVYLSRTQITSWPRDEI